jgi:hypothetical protein
LFSIFSSRGTGEHPEEEWDKFGYGSDRKVEFL